MIRTAHTHSCLLQQGNNLYLRKGCREPDRRLMKSVLEILRQSADYETTLVVSTDQSLVCSALIRLLLLDQCARYLNGRMMTKLDEMGRLFCYHYHFCHKFHFGWEKKRKTKLVDRNFSAAQNNTALVIWIFSLAIL